MKTQTIPISVSIPQVLQGKVEFSAIYKVFGLNHAMQSFAVDLTFTELKLSKSLRSKNVALLQGKVEHVLKIWQAHYHKHLDRLSRESRLTSAEDRTREVRQDLDALENLLSTSLVNNDAVDWDSLKRSEEFRVTPDELLDQKPPAYLQFSENGRPVMYTKLHEPKEPNLDSFKKQHDMLQRLFKGKEIRDKFQGVYSEWQEKLAQAHTDNSERESTYQDYVRSWQKRKDQFDANRIASDRMLSELQDKYDLKEARAIEEYCDLVLHHSHYPDYFPHSWYLEYRDKEAMLILEYELPHYHQMPTVAAYAYVESEKQILMRRHSDEFLQKLYDDVCYQICLRSIHEIFEADVVNAIDQVVFNGLIKSQTDGKDENNVKIVLSVQTTKEYFNQFELSKVNPRATFRLMKGIAMDQLHEAIPIRSVCRMTKWERRTIDESGSEDK